MCQWQWVICEEDIKMELGLQRVYLGVTYVQDKKQDWAGEPQPARHIWLSFSQPSDEFQSKNFPWEEFCAGKKMASFLVLALYSVFGGGLPGKSMALAWKLR